MASISASDATFSGAVGYVIKRAFANGISGLTIATSLLGTGTANSSVFLRGDSTWSNTLVAADNVGALFINDTAPAQGFFIGLQNSGFTKAALGLGPTLLAAAAIDDFSIQTATSFRVAAAGASVAQLLIDGSTGLISIKGAAGSALTVGGNAVTGTITSAINNTSAVAGDDARLTVTSNATQVALFAENAANAAAIVTNGPTGAQTVFRNLGSYPLVFGTNNTYRGDIGATGTWTLAPTTSTAIPSLLINGLENSGPLVIDIQSPVNGGFLSFRNAGVERGFFGTGPAALAGAVLADFSVGADTGILRLSANGVTSLILASGVMLTTQPTPTAFNATATLTIAQLLTLILTTTTAANVTGTLPTGTLTDAGVAGGASQVNTCFDWSVINTGLNLFTLAVGVAHTIVGPLTVPGPGIGMFRTRKTASNTFVTYRIG